MKPMRTLLLDYQNNRRKPGWPDIVLLAGGLATAMYLGIHSVNVFSEIRTLEAKQTAFERKSDRGAPDSRLASLDAQQLRAEVKQANDVLAQLALPWETLFKDIESSQQNHVALLTIEPDSEKRVIKITGEAKDFGAMLGYIRFLQKKESLTGVYLQSHQIEQRTAEKPVRFVLVASWVINP
jgi:Tfp pilus assembly protein PilN